MKIEKGMMFLLKDGIVGTVKSIRDSKKEQYVISTDKDSCVWNNKSQTWSKDTPREYKQLSENNLLVYYANTNEFVGEDSNMESKETKFYLTDGDIYTTTTSDYIVFELSEPVKIFNTYYEYIGVTRDSEASSSTVYFTETGISSNISVQLISYKRNIKL